MAKANEIVGLDCTADATLRAAEVLRGRFEEVVNFRGAALGSDDIEAVHAMRVATRRLRSALRDFAPLLKKRPLKKINEDLKNMADALGTARDQDVAIAALEKLQAKAEKALVKEGIGKLIDERRARRTRTQLDLSEMLAVSVIKNLHEKFTAAIDEAAQKNNEANVVSFNQAGRVAVAARLQEFCDLSVSLYKPFEVKKLHKLRISAKRLRYAVELFANCWGKKIAPFAKEIAEMQSFLGEIHDADIWIEDLSERLCRNDANEIQANLWLLSEFVKDRTKNYRGALEFWSKWKNDRFIERLRTAVLQTVS
ncbi:MAG: CHAD domain-containing protein [Actinomycetota bacterium]